MPATLKMHIFLWRLNKVVYPFCHRWSAEVVEECHCDGDWDSVDIFKRYEGCQALATQVFLDRLVLLEPLLDIRLV